MKADKILTELKSFADPRSYVRRDGSEVLYGDDWKARVAELDDRSGGRCEYNAFRDEEMRCARQAADPDHIVKRSKHRDDRMSNLQALCVFHHRAKHPEKQPQWTRRA